MQQRSIFYVYEIISHHTSWTSMDFFLSSNIYLSTKSMDFNTDH